MLQVKTGRTILGTVNTIAEASMLWRKYRNDNNLGASNSKATYIYNKGKRIAHISYNGRVWSPDGKTPIPI